MYKTRGKVKCKSIFKSLFALTLDFLAAAAATTTLKGGGGGDIIKIVWEL